MGAQWSLSSVLPLTLLLSGTSLALEKPYPEIPQTMDRPAVSFLQQGRGIKSTGSLLRVGEGSVSDDATTDLADRMHQWRDAALERYSRMGCESLAREPVEGSVRNCMWRPDPAKSSFLTRTPVYYIAMGGDAQRRWLANFSRLSPSIHVIEGTRGNDRAAVEDLVTERYEALLTKEVRGKPGVLGCILSHLRSIKAAYDSGEEVALVLEGDALPDLAPWWPQSLEDYIAGLPPGWQASQLSWTTEPQHSHFKYRLPAAGHFARQPSYGTVAYLIHRRGMERIMSYMWREQLGKFDFSRLRPHCPWLTADDCLMSFSPYPGQRGNILDVNSIYQATPPMFTSFARDSRVQAEEKQWVTASFCDDISSALNYNAKHCPATM